jgi:acyl-CoA thioesterase FadM
MLVQTQVLHADSDLLHLHHTLLREPDSERVATVEHMLHHVNTGTAESSPPRPDIARRIQALATAQAALPRPARSGRAIGMR